MTPKKNISLATVALLAMSFALLAGCNSKAEEEQKKRDEAQKQFMHQGDGKVRKPGENHMKEF